MEEIIRNIMNADKEARNAVEKKRQSRNNVQNLIQEQSKKIKETYLEETKQCIAQKNAKLDEEYDFQMKQEQMKLDEAMCHLEKKYEMHRQEWVKEIYHRCLKT